MNQKQKLKQHREDWHEVNQYLWDNQLNDYVHKDGKLFSCNMITYSRTRCKLCNDLINLGDYNVFPRYSFFGSYARSNNMHMKCFVKEVRNDLSHIENYAKYMEFNLNSKDFDMNEVVEN